MNDERNVVVFEGKLPAYEYPDLPPAKVIVINHNMPDDLPGISITIQDAQGENIGDLYIEHRVHDEYGATVYVEVRGYDDMANDPLVMVDLRNSRVIGDRYLQVERGY